MMAVYKYLLSTPLEASFGLKLPRGAEVLTVQAQRGIPVIWALVSLEEVVMEEVHFRLVGTGCSMTERTDTRYVGTFQLSGIDFHLFEFTHRLVRREAP